MPSPDGSAPSVLLLGAFDAGRLETSYSRAFSSLGWSVRHVSLPDLVATTTPLRAAGRLVLRRMAVESWLRKVGAHVVASAKEHRPDLIVMVGMIDFMQLGALAQIRAVLPVQIAWVWPDPLVNFSSEMAAMLPLVDVVATYSSATVDGFVAMGAKRAIWLPLAGDPELHGPSSPAAGPTAQPFDVTFVGSWRAAREQVLNQLGDFDLKIWGHGWKRPARSNALVRRAWQGEAIYGTQLASIVRSSKVNLNIIDPQNYPAANMRVFELLVAGGLEVCSACPEMESSLEHGKHLYYFEDRHELPQLVDDLLRRPEDRQQVARAGSMEVRARHTYADRVKTLATACGFP